MPRQIRTTDLFLGLVLGAIVGILVGAVAVAGLYFSYPDLFEPFVTQMGITGR